MNRSDILDKLTNIFRANFNNDTIILREEMLLEDIPEWDSLEQINLIEAIQGEFHFKMNMKEALSIDTVGKFLDIIENNK